MINENLNVIRDEIWNKLALANNENAIRYIAVSNYANSYINTYTVVLRDADKERGTVSFYTDVRSEKVNEIKQDNRISMVAYTGTDTTQLVLKGAAHVYNQTAVAKFYWDKNGYKGRRSYLAQPSPSTLIDAPVDGLAYLNGKQFLDNDMDGYLNFAVVKITLNWLEWLKLDSAGNRRAKFILDKNNVWQGAWLIP